MKFPEELRYSREHEWVRIDGEVATFGITEHAQKELGDLVFVDLPRAGRTIRAGEPVGTVESVKAVSEVFAPIGGEVLEANGALVDHPERVNQDPHGEGWLARVRIAPGADLAGLMSASEYAAYVAGS